MVNQEVLERVQERIGTHDKRRHGKLTFTVELGRGETYANRKLTVYAHDRYERSSVLSGRDRRMWIGDFGNDGTLADAEETMQAAGAGRITDYECSTFVPVAQIVSHLPDDTDY